MTSLVNLDGGRGLVVGVANEASIAAGCARAFRTAGAELALTYLNDKAPPWVDAVATEVEAALLLPCDVREAGQLEAVFDRIGAEWGRLDFLLHAVAFAPR
jgi:enoyl-[acyl-carrier protein] reductase I